MDSRMNKYYKEKDQKSVSRSIVHADAYRQAYNNYNEEMLPVSDNMTAIDLADLNQVVNSRGDYRKIRDYQGIVEVPQIKKEEVVEPKVQRVYDINELLSKAKQESNLSNTKKLSQTEYNLLQKLKLDNEDLNMTREFKNKELHDEIKKTDESMEKTTTLSLDILEDLRDDASNNGKTISLEKNSSPPVFAKQIIKKEEKDEDFYSGSYTFRKKDFDGNDGRGKGKSLLKGILVLLLILILVAGVGCAIYYFGNF